MSPITTAIPPPRISAGGWPLSRLASIRTPAPSPTASGSKITSTLTKKNYASQIRRGLDGIDLDVLGCEPLPSIGFHRKIRQKSLENTIHGVCAAERPNIVLKCLCIQLGSRHVARTAYMGIFPA